VEYRLPKQEEETILTLTNRFLNYLLGMNQQIKERIVNTLVNQLKSTSTRSSDADWYIGFKPSAETPVEESEYDPKTGNVINNTAVGTHATFLQQWDAAGSGYVEEDDVKRDSGTYSFNLNKPLRTYASKTD